MSKVCSKCEKRKSVEEFYGHKGHKDGLSSQCKICDLKKSKQEYQKNKERRRKQRNSPIGKKHKRNIGLKTKFGITLDNYNQMFIEQNGCCAVCGKHQSKFQRRLAVDHNHETGKVRGLLCPNCNTLLGRIEKAEKTGLMDKINLFRGKQK